MDLIDHRSGTREHRDGENGGNDCVRCNKSVQHGVQDWLFIYVDLSVVFWVDGMGCITGRLLGIFEVHISGL